MHKSFKGFAVSDVSTFGIDLRIWSTCMPIHASASSGERGLHRLVFSINKKVDNRAQKRPFLSYCFIYFIFVLMVRSRRLELPLRLKNSDLNAARLPIPPRPHVVTDVPYPKPKALWRGQRGFFYKGRLYILFRRCLGIRTKRCSFPRDGWGPNFAQTRFNRIRDLSRVLFWRGTSFVNCARVECDGYGAGVRSIWYGSIPKRPTG